MAATRVEGTVYQDDSGYLFCMENEREPPFWCSHILEVVDKGTDAKVITPPTGIQVPLFPVQFGLFVQVTIHPDGGLVKAAIAYKSDYTDFYQPLGLWNPGEGRAVLRSVILDWLRGEMGEAYQVNDPARADVSVKAGCLAPTHGFNEEVYLGRKFTAQEAWVNLFYLRVEKACFACIQKTEPPPLIEEEDVNPKPPWRYQKSKAPVFSIFSSGSIV